MSLLSSQIFDEQNEYITQIYRDAESLLGCSIEIENLIDYFQGSHPQLVNIGLNKLTSLFNQSNQMHLNLKQQFDGQNSTLSQITSCKNECVQITIEVLKQITNKQIQNILNFFIDKNLAQFNIGYQLDLLELDQFNMYSKELLQDLFYNDEQTQNQFIKKQSIEQESSFLKRSLSIKTTKSMKTIILEKIQYRKSAMLNKLEHRFPKLNSVEPIIPYILGLYINIESEGLIGNIMEKKLLLKTVQPDLLNTSLNNFSTLINSDFLKLILKLDTQSFQNGIFDSSYSIEFDKILNNKKWIDYDKLMMQSLLYSSQQRQSFLDEHQQVEQLKEAVQKINAQLIDIFKEIIPHENGNFERNHLKVENLLSDFERLLKNTIQQNQQILNALQKIFQSIIKIIIKFQQKLNSKFGLTILLKLKLQLQDLSKNVQKSNHQYIVITELQQELDKLFRKNSIFICNDLAQMILNSHDTQVDLDNVLSKLKYGCNINGAIQEISQIYDLIENQYIRKVLQDILDYLKDQKKKKEIILNHYEVNLSIQDQEILRCISNKQITDYISENRQFFKNISLYVTNNDPFTTLTLRNYATLQSALEISILSIKFSKGSVLSQFLQLFKDYYSNRLNQQLKLNSQLNDQELNEWKILAHLLL